MRLMGELGANVNQAVMVAGIVIAIARWRHHPRTSRFVIVALALPLLSTLVLPLQVPFVWQWLERMEDSRRNLLVCLDSALWKTARAVSYILLLVVTLGPRRDQRRDNGQGNDRAEGGVS
jgi:hypothetical protein